MVTSKLSDRGYTPSIRELPELLGVVAGGTDDESDAAERAILRVERRHLETCIVQAIEAARAAVRPGRGRLTRLVGRLALLDPKSAAIGTRWLIEALPDADMKTRRFAARALGKMEPNAEIERALVDAWDRSERDDDRRAIGEALGKVGGTEARARLSGTEGFAKANVMLDRAAAREREARIDLTRGAPGDGLRIRFHVREGLEEIASDELGTKWKPAVVGRGVVEATLTSTLSRAAEIRTAIDFGFPIRLRKDAATDEATAIVDALVSREARAIFRAFTEVDADAKIRFRIALDGGKRRALLWRCAELVRERASDLVNDPRESTWEVRVAEDAIVLVPRAFEDQRFAYREDTVAASSHPTIAAAIALVGGRRDDDVVWDPFVGAGAELIERARLGPYKRLIGTDIDPKAIEAARANLARANITNVTLEVGDACDARPKGVTTILTNPPMGRRVHRGSHHDLLTRFAAHAATVLGKGGVLVWTVPEVRIRAAAVAAGLALDRSWKVDMGGFPADLSVHHRRTR